jgi:hypothetical protein
MCSVLYKNREKKHPNIYVVKYLSYKICHILLFVNSQVISVASGAHSIQVHLHAMLPLFITLVYIVAEVIDEAHILN